MTYIIMVVFIIPTLGFYIANFNKEQFLTRSTLIIKGTLIVMFVAIWTYQAKNVISDKQRLQNAIENTELQIGR